MFDEFSDVRSGMNSAASSHSGMATERANTVLAEEGKQCIYH